jgi:YegS/Rv2252/BmrU family lipid kinase
MTTCIVIGNPAAGRGKTKWEDLLESVRAADLDATGRITEYPGHAIELARAARREGARLVIAAGGDGTVHEVVNGLLAERAGDMPALGVIPLGSGCDYAKTFGIPEDPAGAARVIASAAVRDVDAGEITYRQDGTEHRRFFCNIAEVGIGGATVARAAKLPRALGGAVYGLAFCMTLPTYRRADTTIAMDDLTYEGPLVDLVIAIGQVFGGGMKVAPKAHPADGLFDVQVHFGSKLDYVRGLPKVYKGTHIPHPRIREERASTVEVGSDPAGQIEADGEVLGTTPATFKILPGALRLKA